MSGRFPFQGGERFVPSRGIGRSERGCGAGEQANRRKEGEFVRQEGGARRSSLYEEGADVERRDGAPAS